MFTEKAGTLDLRPPSSMSIDEYYRYINSASITDYWLSRSRQTKTSGNELFPGSFDLGQTFDNVFGADAISIVPQALPNLFLDIICRGSTIRHLLRKTGGTAHFFSRKKYR